jgi:protein-tyrosine phosphatase
MIDFHSHLIPGVDDGAADAAGAVEGLRAFAAEGVTASIATPHLRASLLERAAERDEYLAQVDAAWGELVALGGAECPSLRLERGFEVMLDTPAPDLSDPRLRLAGTQFVLVEFPFMTVPPNAGPAIFELKLNGWTPVLAHPERYGNFTDFAAAAEWRQRGAYLQVNCGSLLGRYGPDARDRAWGLLERGLADYVASDYHARGVPRMEECRAALAAAGGEAQAELLLRGNAARLLDGQAPLPVPPLRRARPSLLKRIFGGGR